MEHFEEPDFLGCQAAFDEWPPKFRRTPKTSGTAHSMTQRHIPED